MACDMEEVSSESSKRMKDVDETTTEASWTAVAKGKGKEVWSLEPEGEAEKPEGIGLGSEVNGVSVNPEGESRHRHVRAKTARKEREHQTIMENRVNGKAPREEGAEVQSPKRKVIRMESEETQDHVSESLNLSQEEAEEISFVPSALSFPRGPGSWCDNRCSDKALRFKQFASVVVDDVEESYTVNLCQQCYNERLCGTGPGAVEVLAVEGSGGKEGASWQIVENVGKGPVFQECGSISLLKERKRKSFSRML